MRFIFNVAVGFLSRGFLEIRITHVRCVHWVCKCKIFYIGYLLVILELPEGASVNSDYWGITYGREFIDLAFCPDSACVIIHRNGCWSELFGREDYVILMEGARSWICSFHMPLLAFPLVRWICMCNLSSERMWSLIFMLLGIWIVLGLSNGCPMRSLSRSPWNFEHIVLDPILYPRSGQLLAESKLLLHVEILMLI